MQLHSQQVHCCTSISTRRVQSAGSRLCALKRCTLTHACNRASMQRMRFNVRCQSVELSEKSELAASVLTQFRLRLSAVSLPHPDKAHYGGEDAHFVSEVDGGAFGVADGVGGWQEDGINPADYSKKLMATAQEVLEGSVDIPAALSPENSSFSSSVLESIDSGDTDPQELNRCVRTALAVAHRPTYGTWYYTRHRCATAAAHVVAGDGSQTRLPGSSTACVVRLDRSEGVLRAVNLGDSGFILVRDGQVTFKTKPLEHFFDCPYQLGAYPEYTTATDTVDDAQEYSIAVQPGDVIVAGSDGLWDNCYEYEMLPLLPSSSSDVETAAQAIASMARGNAENPEYESPYTREALNEGIDLSPWEKLLKARIKDGKLQLGKLSGGKQDDITVVVAYVDEETSSDSSSTSEVEETA